MDLSARIGSEKLSSVLKDPFSKVCVKSVFVSYRESISGNKWIASGTVEFTNNNTSGCQHFKGETFDEIILQIKAFINELK